MGKAAGPSNPAVMAIGAATFAALQLTWSLGHAYLGWRGAWVMKAASGFMACFLAFIVVGVVVAAHRHQSGDLLRRAGAVTAGAILAMIVALLLIGPGNLWPLVIVVDGVVVGSGVLLGAVIGTAIGGRHSSRSRGDPH